MTNIADTGGVHRLPVRIYHEDTDFSGVAYHASYLRFMERGRTEWIRELGVSQSAFFQSDARLAFVVRRMAIEFLKPALMDDLVTVETRCVEARGATLDVSQRILRSDDPLVIADVTVACVGGGRPRRIPEDIRRLLALVKAPAACVFSPAGSDNPPR